MFRSFEGSTGWTAVSRPPPRAWRGGQPRRETRTSKIIDPTSFKNRAATITHMAPAQNYSIAEPVRLARLVLHAV